MNDRLSFSGVGECRFGLATVARHKYGELGQEEPHLCLIYGETEEYWIGRWVTINLCYFDVMFPKKTTTKGTLHDMEKYLEIIESDLGRSLIEKHKFDAIKNTLRF